MIISFRPNMNNLDRGFRIIIGLSLILLGPVFEIITSDELSTVILTVIGSMAIISALFSYCILYDVTGIRTLKNSRKTG